MLYKNSVWLQHESDARSIRWSRYSIQVQSGYDPLQAYDESNYDRAKATRRANRAETRHLAGRLPAIEAPKTTPLVLPTISTTSPLESLKPITMELCLPEDFGPGVSTRTRPVDMYPLRIGGFEMDDLQRLDAFRV